VGTRSQQPQDPATDNPMYNLCLLHYNSEGQLIHQDVQTNDCDGVPQLSVSWSPTLTPGSSETLCLVANMQDAYPAPWPETLPMLKETCVELPIQNGGLIKERKMYMFGYYEGAIESGQAIQIMMGRMASTLKLVISAADASTTYTVTKVEIRKPARKTYFFPHPSTADSFTGSGENLFVENLNSSVSATNPLVLYYQTGENISPSEVNRTNVQITAADKTYTVALGADGPGIASEVRNYSLYRNNNYTFNIKLSN
ncbi:MAG: DUF4906 domain-containing protein, partial [Tannerellaceae bacterium]